MRQVAEIWALALHKKRVNQVNTGITAITANSLRVNNRMGISPSLNYMQSEMAGRKDLHFSTSRYFVLWLYSARQRLNAFEAGIGEKLSLSLLLAAKRQEQR